MGGGGGWGGGVDDVTITRVSLLRGSTFQGCRTLGDTMNPNNPNVYEITDKSIGCLKQNKVDGFESLRVLKSKQQMPNLKKILTKA